MLTKALSIGLHIAAICFALAIIGCWVIWGIEAKHEIEAKKVPQTKEMCNRDRFPNVEGANQEWAKCPEIK